MSRSNAADPETTARITQGWTVEVRFERAAGVVRATARLNNGALSGLTGVGEIVPLSGDPTWAASEAAGVRALGELVRELRGIVGDGGHQFADQA